MESSFRRGLARVFAFGAWGIKATLFSAAVVLILMYLIRSMPKEGVDAAVAELYRNNFPGQLLSASPYIVMAAGFLVVLVLIFKPFVSDIQDEPKSLSLPSTSTGSAPVDGPLVPLDLSTPDRLFHGARRRLLDDAARIDLKSRRNLGLGIVFSVFALAVLAWPLLAAVFQPADAKQLDVFTWAAQYYLPRFAVGLLLQFVGFFFLRLYVANELDLKHNKNEITNLELRVMAVQLAQAFNDAASRKEIVKSLLATERNFVIKKNEKTTSAEMQSEYNDLRELVGKLVDKLPSDKARSARHRLLTR